MLLRSLLVLILAMCPVLAEVKIHDKMVRLLAKPYGVEERIKLECIDEVHFGPNGTGRLVITLENSGVKEVRLQKPVFALEVMGADGKACNLGQMTIPEIVFPATGGDRSVKRCYVVELKPCVSGTAVTHRLRDAAKKGETVSFRGTSGLWVAMGGEKSFQRKGVKLELAGPVVLGKGFKPVWHRKAGALPKCGLVR